ncbi:MAG: IS110 family transposase [Bacteroidota bacterium]|nr:IS110 family transposase [Bacteroidota bacterium]
MNKFKAFTGIDISKKTFDAALLFSQTGLVHHHCFSQTTEGFLSFANWLASHQVPLQDTLICMEHTGLYTNGIIDFLAGLKANLWVEMAIKIKRSMGLQRGTDDKASSIIIAEYCMRFSDRARFWKPVDTRLSKLKNMIVQRDRIVNALTQLSVPIEEMKSCNAAGEAAELERLQLPAIKGLTKAKEKIEASIQSYIASDETINKSIQLMCSIKGVGLQTAASLFVYTKGFTMFGNAKQLACYCGVVPFSKSSGTSVRFKPGVSPFANHKLKSLLHLCAMSALRWDKEIKAYYERKVKEGKNKMSIINAIRNKLLLRIFAVLRDQRPFVENYQLASV